MDNGNNAQNLVMRLLQEGKLSHIEISEQLGGRVSPRTIYRWAKGESVPHNVSDFNALARLVASRLEQNT